MAVALVGTGGSDQDDWAVDDWPGDEWPEVAVDGDQARLDLAPESDLVDVELDLGDGQVEHPDDPGDDQAWWDLAPDEDLAAATDRAPAPLARPGEDVEAPDRDQQIAQLRRRLAAVPATGARAGEVGSRSSAPSADPEDDGVVTVPAPLRRLLPRGGLVRGSVVGLSGSSSLVTGLLAGVTAAGGWAGVVGHPDLGVLAAAEMGADLRRVALVPHPGSDPVDVAAVLLDGMDLVVLDLAGLAVTPSRARAVVARARHRGAVLAVVGGTWPGVELELHAEVTAHLGLGWGHGRVAGRELLVRVRGRGQANRERTGEVSLRSERGAVRWSAVSEPPAALERTGT
ncbi:hypothetical protein GCM10027047_08740 [Rhodococcus aerolatus]